MSNEFALVNMLAAARKDARLPRCRVASCLPSSRGGDTLRTLGSWERGERLPSLANFVIWARALGYDVKLEKRVDAAPKSGQP